MLKPHIPVLATALLEALSGLEPQAMNYLSLHLGKTPDSQEKVIYYAIVITHKFIIIFNQDN